MSYKNKMNEMIHTTVDAMHPVRTFKWSLLDVDSLKEPVADYRNVTYKTLNKPSIPKHVVSSSIALRRHASSTSTVTHVYGTGNFKNIKIKEKHRTGKTINTTVSVPVKPSPNPDQEMTDYLHQYYDAFSVDTPQVSYQTVPGAADSLKLRHSLLFGVQSASPVIAMICLGRTSQLATPRHNPGVIAELTDIWKGVQAGRVDLFRSYPHLHALLKTLRTVNRRKDKFIELIAYIAMSLQSSFIHTSRPYTTSPRDILYVIGAIEGLNAVTPSIPRGYVIAAPPGAGKTTLACVSGISFIDTNLLDVQAIRRDPSILDRIVNSGISVITHEWDFKQWKSLVFVIRPDDFERHARSLGFGDFDSTSSDALSLDVKRQRKEFYRTRVKERNIPVDKGANDMIKYRDVFMSATRHVYEFRAGESLVDGFLAILHDFQACL